MKTNPAAAVLNPMMSRMDNGRDASGMEPSAGNAEEGLFKAPRGARGSRRWMLPVWALALLVLGSTSRAITSSAVVSRDGGRWIGTWATAPQPSLPKTQTFGNQTLRLIVHTSAGGTKVRIRISNTYGDQPLVIGSAHIARRTAAAEIDPASDRRLMFRGHPSATIAARSMVVSDPVELDVPALSDLAISLFLPKPTVVTTTHILALQTSYVSPETGDSTADVKFPVAKTINSWPFLTGVDIAASARGAAIVAFGSSTTDGDGSTKDANRRWPDVLAERLLKDASPKPEFGVLNEGIIGNRLLNDSPRQANNPFGAALGQAGLARFERDVLAQSGVRYVFVCLGINDIAFPAFPFTPATETVRAQDIISGYRQLIASAHKKGIRIIGTTMPPFENSMFEVPRVSFYTPERETVRHTVNEWILKSGEFDATVDFDAAVRDPSHPTQLLPGYDAGDHLHVNDAGNVAQGNLVPLGLFEGH
jgi:lysophospholipase L1-like esterase